MCVVSQQLTLSEDDPCQQSSLLGDSDVVLAQPLAKLDGGIEEGHVFLLANLVSAREDDALVFRSVVEGSSEESDLGHTCLHENTQVIAVQLQKTHM